MGLPIVGLNHKRGKRMQWDEFDALMTDAYVSYENISVSRNGLHETIVKCGSLADGTPFRSREFYSI